MQPCIIKQDRQEHFNVKRGWFVNAYRIVSPETGHDLVQPWSGSKKEARETAKELGYTIVGWELSRVGSDDSKLGPLLS